MTDPERAKAYQRKRYGYALIHLGLELALVAAFLFSGLTERAKECAESFSGNFYAQAAVYLALFFGYLTPFNLGFALFADFRLEQEYGLSNQNFRGWLLEFFKKLALSLVLFLLLGLGLYSLIRHFPGNWWVWAWLGFAAVSYLLGQLFPVLIVPLFYRYSRVEDEALKQRVFALVKRFGLPLENVYSLNLSKTTKKANAMFAGLGRTKRLVLADTLISKFTPEEIESVVAHELGHFRHRDIWHHLGFNLVTSFVGFWLAYSLVGTLAAALGYGGAHDLAAFPLLYLIFFAFAVLLTPLSNAYSRWREREADRFALRAVGPTGFIPAMEKLAELNLADPNPHPLIEWWFYTHPPIGKRIQMARTGAWLVFLFCLAPLVGLAQGDEKRSEREETIKDLEARGRTEILSYFYGEPKDASGLKLPLAIDLYNQAVEFFQMKEYALAREALEDSLRYDPKNPLAHELLGDIAYYEQKLDEALGHYQAALRLKTGQALKEKMERVQKEKKLESGFATYGEEHFLIKYKGEDRGIEGFELRELLRNSYRAVGQDLGYFFKHKVVVLLYDEAEFRALEGIPHWSSGVYDGKIRVPAYQKGFTLKEIEKIMRHEVTHAFVVEISRGRCPAWLNEGLAEYEEAKVEKPDLKVFRAAVRTGTLFPLLAVLTQEELLKMKEPLEVQLFYEESHQLVNYLVERYGMFRVKQMLEGFAQGKDSFQGIQEVLKISPLELEKRWKETLVG